MSEFCSTCKAPILWAITSGGHPMPIDPDPVADGNLRRRRDAARRRGPALEPRARRVVVRRALPHLPLRRPTPEEEMTEMRLVGFEAAAVRGADLLDDGELAGRLAEAIDEAAVDQAVDAHSRVQDLRELAALALVAARRLSR
jgi:hypothetical protein